MDMNEKEFNGIVKDDLANFNDLVEKKYFDTSDFVNIAEKLCFSLQVFLQDIKRYEN